MRGCPGILLRLLAMAFAAHAAAAAPGLAPRVLYDSGDTQPIGKLPYRLRPARPVPGPAEAEKAVPLSAPAVNAPQAPDSKPVVDGLLPIVTPALSFGRIEKRKADFPVLKRPLCIIGSDERSLAWLVTYHRRLRAIRARCALVQAANLDDLKRVGGFAAGIPVIPMPGGVLAKRFGVKHYPVLISRKWIEQ